MTKDIRDDGRLFAKGQDADEETERVDLSASEIACAVADEYERTSFNASVGWWHDMPSGLRMALDRLEEITRPSALRKVRP